MKNFRSIVLALLVVGFAFNFSSCKKDDDSEKRAEEKRKIENYLLENSLSVTPTESGLYYIETLAGTGVTPTDSDYVLVKYTARDLNGKIFDLTNLDDAKLQSVTPVYALGEPVKIGIKGYYLPGVSEGLKHMKEGGKARLIMPSILAYNDYVPRIYDIELLKVIHNPMAFEKDLIASFLTPLGKSVSDSLSSGVYYVETAAGTGDAPITSKKVSIKYKGYLADGRVFDKTKDFPNTTSDNLFSFYVGSGQVVPGMDEGIRMMKKGGKGTLVIPFYRGYGFNEVIFGGQVVLPLFSTIIFDIELVNVE